MVNTFGQEIGDVFYTVDSLGVAHYISNDTDMNASQHSYMYSQSSDYQQYLSSGMQELANDLQAYQQYINDMRD